MTCSSKSREQLEAMTVKQLREYAKQIGCCLSYDGARKETMINAISSHQEYVRSGRWKS